MSAVEENRVSLKKVDHGVRLLHKKINHPRQSIKLLKKKYLTNRTRAKGIQSQDGRLVEKNGVLKQNRAAMIMVKRL